MSGEGMVVRSRLVARDFKGGDKDRDDLFAGSPPLEAKRMLLSRAVTRMVDGRVRKLMFVDARKAHLNPMCEKDEYIELPSECGVGEAFEERDGHKKLKKIQYQTIDTEIKGAPEIRSIHFQKTV